MARSARPISALPSRRASTPAGSELGAHCGGLARLSVGSCHFSNRDEGSMPTMSEWKVPQAAQPKPEEYGYDLDRALSSVVGLKATVPDDAFTAEILGTERAGNGAVINNRGLVLTIGYLITEADSIWLT